MGAGKGNYDRLPESAIVIRDAELARLKMTPKNTKRRAQAWRDALAKNLVKDTVLAKIAKAVEQAAKEEAAAPAKAKPVKETKEHKAERKALTKKLKSAPTFADVAAKAPAKTEPKAKRAYNRKASTQAPAAPVGAVYDSEHFAAVRKIDRAREVLNIVSDARGRLGEFASEEQHNRFSVIIDQHLTDYEQARLAAFPPAPPVPEVVEPAPQPEPIVPVAAAPVEVEEPEEDPGIEGETAPAVTTMAPPPPPPMLGTLPPPPPPPRPPST